MVNNDIIKYLLLLLFFNRLYIPTEYKGKPIIHDLYTWLKTEPELTFSGIKNVILVIIIS